MMQPSQIRRRLRSDGEVAPCWKLVRRWLATLLFLFALIITLVMMVDDSSLLYSTHVKHELLLSVSLFP